MATSVKQYEKGPLSGLPKLVIIWYRQNHPWVCFYCGALLDSATRTRDHVVPRCNGQAVKDNIVPCCKTMQRPEGENVYELIPRSQRAAVLG